MESGGKDDIQNKDIFNVKGPESEGSKLFGWENQDFCIVLSKTTKKIGQDNVLATIFNDGYNNISKNWFLCVVFDGHGENGHVVVNKLKELFVEEIKIMIKNMTNINPLGKTNDVYFQKMFEELFLKIDIKLFEWWTKDIQGLTSKKQINQHFGGAVCAGFMMNAFHLISFKLGDSHVGFSFIDVNIDETKDEKTNKEAIEKLKIFRDEINDKSGDINYKIKKFAERQKYMNNLINQFGFGKVEEYVKLPTHTFENEMKSNGKHEKEHTQLLKSNNWVDESGRIITKDHDLGPSHTFGDFDEVNGYKLEDGKYISEKRTPALPYVVYKNFFKDYSEKIASNIKALLFCYVASDGLEMMSQNIESADKVGEFDYKFFSTIVNIINEQISKRKQLESGKRINININIVPIYLENTCVLFGLINDSLHEQIKQNPQDKNKYYIDDFSLSFFAIYPGMFYNYDEKKLKRITNIYFHQNTEIKNIIQTLKPKICNEDDRCKLLNPKILDNLIEQNNEIEEEEVLEEKTIGETQMELLAIEKSNKVIELEDFSASQSAVFVANSIPDIIRKGDSYLEIYSSFVKWVESFVIYQNNKYSIPFSVDKKNKEIVSALIDPKNWNLSNKDQIPNIDIQNIDITEIMLNDFDLFLNDFEYIITPLYFYEKERLYLKLYCLMTLFDEYINQPRTLPNVVMKYTEILEKIVPLFFKFFPLISIEDIDVPKSHQLIRIINDDLQNLSRLKNIKLIDLVLGCVSFKNRTLYDEFRKRIKNKSMFLKDIDFQNEHDDQFEIKIKVFDLGSYSYVTIKTLLLSLPEQNTQGENTENNNNNPSPNIIEKNKLNLCFGSDEFIDLKLMNDNLDKLMDTGLFFEIEHFQKQHVVNNLSGNQQIFECVEGENYINILSNDEFILKYNSSLKKFLTNIEKIRELNVDFKIEHQVVYKFMLFIYNMIKNNITFCQVDSICKNFYKKKNYFFTWDDFCEVRDNKGDVRLIIRTPWKFTVLNKDYFKLQEELRNVVECFCVLFNTTLLHIKTTDDEDEQKLLDGKLKKLFKLFEKEFLFRKFENEKNNIIVDKSVLYIMKCGFSGKKKIIKNWVSCDLNNSRQFIVVENYNNQWEDNIEINGSTIKIKFNGTEFNNLCENVRTRYKKKEGNTPIEYLRNQKLIIVKSPEKLKHLFNLDIDHNEKRENEIKDWVNDVIIIASNLKIPKNIITRCETQLFDATKAINLSVMNQWLLFISFQFWKRTDFTNFEKSYQNVFHMKYKPFPLLIPYKGLIERTNLKNIPGYFNFLSKEGWFDSNSIQQKQ